MWKDIISETVSLDNVYLISANKGGQTVVLDKMQHIFDIKQLLSDLNKFFNVKMTIQILCVSLRKSKVCLPTFLHMKLF